MIFDKNIHVCVYVQLHMYMYKVYVWFFFLLKMMTNNLVFLS